MRGNLTKTPNSKIYNLSYLVLVVLLLLTIGITYIFYNSSKNKDLIRFANQSAGLRMAIESRINLYIALLKGTHGFVESSDNLNAFKFATYIKSLEIEANYPGLQGIGFTNVFKAEETTALEKKIRAEGFPDFRVFPESDGRVRQSIIYLEPFNERNRRAQGYDMSTEPTRRKALDEARDTGRPAVSGKVRLMQEIDNDIQEGFLIYLPVYRAGGIPETVEARRDRIKGFVFSPFRAGNFLQEIHENSRDVEIAVKIYDGEAKAENLLAQTRHTEAETRKRFGSDTFMTTDVIDVAGRKWIVEFSSLETFSDQSNLFWTPIIFFSGIGLSFLLFGMTYSEAKSRERLQNYASDLYDLQQEREVLYENESKARKAAEEANDVKDEFIAIVSHELKTPLNTIAGWVRIIKSDDISAQTRNLALAKIDKNIRLQAKLIEQLLSYSEIISKTTEPRGDQIDLAALVDEVIADNETIASENDILLLKDYDDSKNIVKGDAEKLKLLVGNLLSNALKFTQKGGKIEIKISEEKEFTRFEIKDNGRGIAADYLPYIFESYKQAEKTNTREFGGLGLGLAISKQIVKLHHGSIEVHSEGQGKGTQFIVKIPLLTK